MFQGTSALSLDDKGRLTVPARQREALREHGPDLTLTFHPRGFLMLMPRAVWALKVQEMRGWSQAFGDLRRDLIGSAEDLVLDSAGRILISPELRADAGLERSVRFVGNDTHFEIWDAATLDARRQRARAALTDEMLERIRL